MEIKIPKSAYLEEPHKVEGLPKEMRQSFYEMAKSKIRWGTTEEIREWEKKHRNEDIVSTASYIIRISTEAGKEKNINKWVNALEIIINVDCFKINGKDYYDLVPYVLEHEIFEAWLKAKKGVGPDLSLKKKHLLARRREYELAARDGKGEKMFEWHMAINPDCEAECRYALEKAKARLQEEKK